MASSKHGVTVTQWTEAEPPTEGAIQRKLRAERLNAYGWGNGPGDLYCAHSHSYNKVIYVVRGSIVFGLPEFGERLSLSAGDRLYLPAGTTHNAEVGSDGVYCLEAHC